MTKEGKFLENFTGEKKAQKMIFKFSFPFKWQNTISDTENVKYTEILFTFVL